VYILPADEKAIAKERQLYWGSQGMEGYFKLSISHQEGI
jgi:hypothetical protein